MLNDQRTILKSKKELIGLLGYVFRMKISLWGSPYEPLSDTGVHNKATGWPRSGYANGKGKKEDENNVLFFSTFSFLWVDLEKTIVKKTSPIEGSVVMFESLRLLTILLLFSTIWEVMNEWARHAMGDRLINLQNRFILVLYKAPRVIKGAILLLSI